MSRSVHILRRQSGVAIITVILILSILIAAALELNRASRADIYDAANLGDTVKLSYIAKSGFYGAAALVVNSQTNYETLRDDWANAELLSLQSRTFFPNGYFIVRIEDEKGKIPLNKLVSDGSAEGDIKAPLIRAMLMRLLQLPEFDLDELEATEIVDALTDWMDENDEVTGHGAESFYYLSQRPPYSAKNAPPDCIEELLMVKGMAPEIFAGTAEKPGLNQMVTLYGTGAININTAPKLVLQALPATSGGAPVEITAEMAGQMDAYRRDAQNNLSSTDWYKKISGMEAMTIDARLIDMVKSNAFKIVATGISDRMTLRITSTIQRSPFLILDWRQE